jgi:AcrR family transcriptional regulator
MSSNSGSGDLRIRRTRLALREALLALIEEKGFAAIIVQDIADRAMINRVTFYKHYQDKYALLEHTMHEIGAELLAHVAPVEDEPAPTMIFGILVRWLEQVSANASFYRTMLGKTGNAAFAAQIRGDFERLVAESMRRLSTTRNQASANFPLKLRFAAAGFVGVTEWWLDQRHPLKLEEVARELQVILLQVMKPVE